MVNSPPPFLPLTISWNLTKRCNLACAHCYIEASAKEKGIGELSTREALEILDQIAQVNPQAVLILTGGEPLLRRDLPEILSRAHALGFWTVLGSHGGLLNSETAVKLAGAGLKGVGVSLDSLDPQKHDRFRGIPKAWENTVSAMERMKENELPFLIEMTVTCTNRSEIPRMAEFAYQKGATALNIFFLVPTGRGADLNDLSPQEYEETLTELAGLQERFQGKILINAKCAPHYRRVLWERNPESPFVRTFKGGGCPAGTYYCRITPTGEVTPCPYMPLSVGNLKKTPFQELWGNSPILKDFRDNKLKGRCGECEFNELCAGCRCRAYAMTGDYLAEDPSCTYRPGKYGKESIPLPPERTYGAAEIMMLHWTPEAEGSLSKVPFFARGMVRRAVETAAKKRGQDVVTEELLRELRQKMAGRFPKAC